jgi:predicted metal-binding membrane protein
MGDMRGMHGTSDMGGVAGVTGPGRASLPMVALMVASMMTPLIIPVVRHALARSLRTRRRRVVALLAASHAAVWLAGGIALQAAAPGLVDLLGPVAAPVAGLVIAVAWQATPAAQRCGNQHHAHPPLAAFGVTADRELVGFGTRHAAQCLGACWPLMLLPALCGPYPLAAMALCSGWVWVQALENPSVPRWGLRAPVRAPRLVVGRWRSLTGPAAVPSPAVDPAVSL